MDFKNLKSYRALSGILKNTTLHDLQVVDSLKILHRKCGIFIYPVGTGKTYLAASAIRMLMNEKSDRKFLFVMKFSQLAQTPLKLERLLGLRTITTTAESSKIKSVIESEKFLDYDILIITHDCLNSDRFTDVLYKHRDKFCCIIIDEIHNLSNIMGSKRGAMIKAMCSKFEYRIGLTATPITSNLEQLCNISNLIDPVKYNDTRSLYNSLINGRVSLEDDPCFFIIRTRSELDADIKVNASIRLIEALPHQFNLTGEELINACRVNGKQQLADLVSVIKEKIGKGKRGLVYINRHKIREKVESIFRENGIRYCSINGNTSTEDRMFFMEKFNKDREYDVVITSITEAIDLDCDYVYFYELTLNVEQMIGRATRGLKKKIIDVFFSVTDSTGEVEYFDKVLEVNKVIRGILGHGCESLDQLGGGVHDIH